MSVTSFAAHTLRAVWKFTPWRRGRRWTARAAHSSGLLDSRQPSSSLSLVEDARRPKHGFESRTGFGRQASLFEIAFEGLAVAA